VNFVLVCAEPSKFISSLEKVVPSDVIKEITDDNLGNCQGIEGRCIAVSDTPSGLVIVIYVRPTATIPVVAHEALHAVSFVLRAKEVPHTGDTEEAYTYYLEWLLREVMARIVKK
jgi:hypothetical protein